MADDFEAVVCRLACSTDGSGRMADVNEGLAGLALGATVSSSERQEVRKKPLALSFWARSDLLEASRVPRCVWPEAFVAMKLNFGTDAGYSSSVQTRIISSTEVLPLTTAIA